MNTKRTTVTHCIKPTEWKIGGYSAASLRLWLRGDAAVRGHLGSWHVPVGSPLIPKPSEQGARLKQPICSSEMPQEIRGSQPTKTHIVLSVLDVEENSLISPFFPSFLSSYSAKLLKTQTLLLWYSEPMFSHKWKTKTDNYISPSKGKNCKCSSSILEICLSNDRETSIF